MHDNVYVLRNLYQDHISKWFLGTRSSVYIQTFCCLCSASVYPASVLIFSVLILISLQRSVYWSLSLHVTLSFDKWWWRWQQRWFIFCRTAEEAFVKDRDTTQPGGEWEKICRICEFNPKNSKNTKDVSRLRSILLQLKQTPLVRWTATFPAQIRCRVLWLWNV